MSRIFIVGARSLGTATGVALLRAGHRVTFVEADAEPARRLAGSGLDVRPGLELAGEPESFVFLCGPAGGPESTGSKAPAGEPASTGAGAFDLRAVEAGAVLVGRALATADARHVVVVRSTVPPGTTGELVGPALERFSGKDDGAGFGLAACPDLGEAMTVIGARSQRVAHRVADLLASPGGRIRIFDDPATAELVRCATSLFNATKISFWNEIWGVCEQLGLDPDPIAETVAGAARGSLDPAYGLLGGAPYGGRRLPADTRGFLGYAAAMGIPMPLLSAVVEVNTALEDRMSAELDIAAVLSMIPRHPPACPRRRADETDHLDRLDPFDELSGLDRPDGLSGLERPGDATGLGWPGEPDRCDGAPDGLPVDDRARIEARRHELARIDELARDDLGLDDLGLDEPALDRSDRSDRSEPVGSSEAPTTFEAPEPGATGPDEAATRPVAEHVADRRWAEPEPRPGETPGRTPGRRGSGLRIPRQLRR
jgi:UDPglucose 6-dehydrogenase